MTTQSFSPNSLLASIKNNKVYQFLESIIQSPKFKFSIAALPAALIYVLSYSSANLASFAISWQIAIPLLATTGTIISGYGYLKGAYINLKQLVNNLKKAFKDRKMPELPALGMNMLISLSLTTSIVYGLALGSAAPLVVFLSPLVTLTALSVSKYFKDLNIQYRNKVSKATLDNYKLFLPIKKSLEYKKDNIYTINPGEIIPVDGVLLGKINPDGSLKDSAKLRDCTLITGEEYKTLEYNKNSLIYAGMTNKSKKPISIQATCDGKDSVYHQMMQNLESHKFSDRSEKINNISKYFVPIILLSALASLTYWGISAGLHAGMTSMMGVFFGACPCALMIAKNTPFAVLKNMLFGENIVINNDSFIEKFPQADTLVFDKTGTLTTLRFNKLSFFDNPSLIDKQTLNETLYLSEKRRLESTIELESGKNAKRANCAFANAVVDAYHGDILNTEAKDITLIDNARNGITTLNSHTNMTLHIGSKEYLEKFGYVIPRHQTDESTDTQVYVGVTNQAGIKQVQAVVEFNQQLRPEAQKAIRNLREAGYDIKMLTGDNSVSAQKIASKLKIAGDDYHSNFSPEQKAEYIKSLIQQGRKVVMIGDGFNDLKPAQACNIGSIAIGASSIMNGFFDVTLTKLTDIIKLRKLFTQANSNQKMILNWSLGYNFLAMFLGGVVFPAQGHGAMMDCLGTCMAFSSLAASAMSAWLPYQLRTTVNELKRFDKKPKIFSSLKSENKSSVQVKSTTQSPTYDAGQLMAYSSQVTDEGEPSAVSPTTGTAKNNKFYEVTLDTYGMCVSCEQRFDDCVVALRQNINILDYLRSKDNTTYHISLTIETNDIDNAIQEIKDKFKGEQILQPVAYNELVDSDSKLPHSARMGKVA